MFNSLKMHLHIGPVVGDDRLCGAISGPLDKKTIAHQTIKCAVPSKDERLDPKNGL